MTAPVVLTKWCRDCGETKPASEFHARPGRRDGLNTYCKPCTIARVNASVARRRAAMGDETWRARERERSAATRKGSGADAHRAYMRARSAATWELVRRHRKEFDHLLLLARRGELNTKAAS